MNAPTAPVSHPGHPRLHLPLHPSASWGVPAVLAVLFGGWVMFVDHNQGSSIPAAAVLGVVSAVVLGALCYALGRRTPGVMPEIRAMLYGAVLGCALGFLHSVSGGSVLRSAGIGLGSGLAMAAMSYYVFHVWKPRPPA
ncbi:hypothetical protein AB0B12_04445 [Streptomyces sp. NPDC044780]|uniref:Integral membrane protein n=1 Tax=Streptomyces luomodiensis TaxID=3026192 RepID=A0ABY9V0L5_9ACTN|nr:MULTISPECIES: hypothetical protein [unclassified Streptomyces]WAP57851.1 hypothetical protein N6H00_24460 [Streptomyces sp. S465]WNE98405.1 hypothetical protein PS467_25275 [Streptomyces sp. SCA4-21]